jgi:hypothetical protein
MKTTALLLILTVLSSCAKKSVLQFKDPAADAQRAALQTKEINRERELLETRKKAEWNQIMTDGSEGFKDLKPLLQNKCFACHDTNTKLAFYGRIFRGHNPINAHRENGIRTLDFVEGFPFKANGNPPQIALLKAIKAAVTDKTMPIKAYRIVYPWKKLNQDDQKEILAWVDTLIEKMEDYGKRYPDVVHGVAGEAKKILELKCFRCHANGNSRGNFAGMEDLNALGKSQYIDSVHPEDSKLFKIMSSGKMPPDPREAATPQELNVLRDWITSLQPK